MIINKKFLSYPCFVLLFCSFLAIGIQSASAQEVHAFNRFQYHNYSWKALHTEAFHVFFPKGYDSLASFASVQLPDIMAEVKKDIGTDIKSTPNLIIYPSPDQLYESNIGLYETQIQTFPTINLKGSRVVVAFDGSWEHFRLQLKEAWVRLSWEEQFKNDAEEQLTNRKQLMPSWFKKGCTRYFTKGWGIYDEDALEQVFKQQPLDWEALISRNESLAGQAFCYFLSKKYRNDAAKQILFQLRQGKSLGKAARLITKRKLDTLKAQCFNFYQQRYIDPSNDNFITADTLGSFLEKTYKGQLFSLAYNEDSSYVFFIIAKDNHREIYLAQTKVLRNGKEEVKPFAKYSMPPWLDDFSKDPYPVMHWKQTNGVDIVLPVKGKMLLQHYNLHGVLTGTDVLYGIDGINEIEEWNKDFLLSAYRKGRSDIISYDPQRLRYKAWTGDQADHTELTLSEKDGMIAYRSGYPADSLYHKDSLAKDYGIYTQSVQGEAKLIAKTKDKQITRDSAYITWHDPKAIDINAVGIATTINGFIQADTVSLQDISSVQHPTSNIQNSLTPWLKEYLAEQKKKDSINNLLLKLKKQDVSVLKNILNPGDSKAAAQMHEDSVRKALAYTPKKIRPYILQLFSAYFSAKVNNDYYINRYQPFGAYLGTFKFPEVGAMAQGGFSDLFDNHHFNIGYRLPAGAEGSDFFVRYENTAKKLDWHILFFRKVESLQPDPQRDWKDNQGNPYPQAAKVKTHYYELGFHYPLHYDWSLDFTTAARRDRTVFLATDRYSLNYAALQTWWSISTLSLAVHKLQPTIPFLYKGWEAKATLDVMASTGKASTVVYGTQLKLAYHQPLIKDITLVAQVQAGYSGGESKILYNFGGLDNNIVPRVDTSVRFGQDAGYAFQTLVTPFRGYEQNRIYGSRYGLLNLDVYFPLFRSLIPLKTSFGAVNNLQLGLFMDVAMAGQQYMPAGMKSTLSAYGFSARTMLAGYPIRFDMAWPGSFDQKPVWYLSLTIK
ncbi:MAG: hypothetical protein WC756_10855 [Taibaiella sp.]|jgi:hypothetical protein